MDGFSANDTIPLPRLRTLLAAGILGAIAWFVWGEWKNDLDRQALWDTTAPSVKRAQAVGKFVELGPAAVPELIAALERGDDHARELAGMALAQIGPAASSAGPSLAKLLSDPDESMRLVALRALGRIRYPLEQEIPRVAALLSAEDPTSREEAVSVLTSLGPDVIPAACRELQRSSGAMLLRDRSRPGGRGRSWCDRCVAWLRYGCRRRCPQHLFPKSGTVGRVDAGGAGCRAASRGTVDCGSRRA